MIPYFRYLKGSLFFYIIMGLLCGLCVGLFSVSISYRKSSERVLEQIKSNLSTASQIREEDEDLKKKIGLIKGLLPPDYAQKNPEVSILESLDRLKVEFPSYRVTVTEFKSEGNILSIGFTAQGSIENYREFVNRINILEGPGFPSLSIHKLTINITEQGENYLQFSGNVRTLKTAGGSHE
jgi:hypothetical protein